MVEAGGVEPPSEEPCGQKTTCLSRSLTAFAGGTKERAITNRQLSCEISPQILRRQIQGQPALMASGLPPGGPDRVDALPN